MQSAILNPKKISAIIAACSMAVAVQAQLIDPLTGGLAGYTTTLVLDNSLGAGSGVSFTSSGSGLSDNYVGSTTTPEQALFLAPVSSFTTTYVVGKRLSVNVAIPVTTAQLDFGLAVADTATPTGAAAGNGFNSRTNFDWASVSVRSQQGSVRGGDDISHVLTTSFNTALASSAVSQLYIDWVSTDVFNLGYVDSSSVSHLLYTATFAGSSTIGTAIGFYGDMRNAGGTTIGFFNNLTISPIPEPSTLALCGMGFTGLLVAMRRKK